MIRLLLFFLFSGILFCVGLLGVDVAVELVKEKVIFLEKIKAVVVEFTLVWIWVAPEVLGISKLISTVFCISDSLNYCIQY
jgi:hypothetical protein